MIKKLTKLPMNTFNSFLVLSIGNSSGKMSISMDVALCVDNAKTPCSVIREAKNCPGRDADGNDISGLNYTLYGVNRKNF